MLFIADINHLSVETVNHIADENKDAGVLIFCQENSTISFQMHMALNRLTQSSFQVTDGSEVQKAFYTGIAYAKDPDIRFCENCSIKGILEPEPVKAKRTRQTKKTAPKQDTATQKKDDSVQKKPAETTKKKEPDTAEKETVNTKAVQSVPQKKVEVFPKRKNSAEPPSIWAQGQSDHDFFSRFCAIPEKTKDRDALIDDIARIIYQSSNVNEALTEIKKIHGKEISDIVGKNINLLATSIRNGISKQVDKIIIP